MKIESIKVRISTKKSIEIKIEDAKKLCESLNELFYPVDNPHETPELREIQDGDHVI